MQEYAIIPTMDTETFFSNVTAITILDADEPIPYKENALVFSMGAAGDFRRAFVEVTEDVFDEFISSSDVSRQKITERVFNLYI